MANNRLLLVCRRCQRLNDLMPTEKRDASIAIARLQVGMEGQWLPSRITPEAFEEWLRVHGDCGEAGTRFLDVELHAENGQGLYARES